MAQPGWYPDPSGRPAHFRYWDGSQWSAETTTNPSAQPPPGQSGPSGGTSSGGRSKVALAVVGAVLVLVLVVVLVIRNLVDDPGVTSAPPSPTSTVSAWDETSEPDPSPSQTPPPSPEPPPEEISCPEGTTGPPPNQPDDDRVSSTKLSFTQVAPYGAPMPKYALTWFHDTMSQSQSTEPGWESFFAVGDIEVQEYFDTPGNAATASMQCMINDNFFAEFSGRKDLTNQAIEVDGHPGWMISSEIRVDDPGLSVEGDVVTLIFVDDGREDRLSGYVGVVPIGDEERIAIADRVASSLRVGG
ncbi:MAG: DUF2510 domain-containing protein [Propionibacteriaceae bacterium]